MRRALLFLASLALASTVALGQAQFFEVTVENISPAYTYAGSGVFNTPVDSAGPGPIFPGAKYQFNFEAAPGHYLSFATMFVQSNDLFYAPADSGMALYDADGAPITGDRTAELLLWDAGTEVNEAPGEGANQAPRQAAGDTGDDETDGVVKVVDDGFTYAATDAVILFTLEHNGATGFTATIENVSDGTTQTTSGDPVPVPMAPGVYVVHGGGEKPLFTDGEADRGEGLEGIAEDGAAGTLGEGLAAISGVTAVFAPGVWATHTDADPLFTDGADERGLGLEGLAEDGSVAMLAGALLAESTTTGGAFLVPTGADGPGPLTPGNSYKFVVSATPGPAALSFATMYVQSNDLFYAPSGAGIPLWDDAGNDLSGDITDQLLLWDAGTEADEALGFGANQAPRQSGPDTGDDDPDTTVRLAEGPAATDVLRVTIRPVWATNFHVKIENVSTDTTLATSGDPVPVPMAPGVAVVTSAHNPLFRDGEPDRGLGLEGIAEDGAAGDLGGVLAAKIGYNSLVFNTPTGADGPGPLLPGNSYEFDIAGVPGTALHFATMMVQSNDLFFAPDGQGIHLFDADGNPKSGDITEYVMLWDGGTEVNEEPGVGANQAPRQSGPNTGDDEVDGVVKLVDDGFTYPDNASMIKVTLEATSVAVEEGPEGVIQDIVLDGAYPNPFNPTTRINLRVRDAQNVAAHLYDVQGRLVRTLFEGRINGNETKTLLVDGGGLSSGLYLVRVEGQATMATQRITLVK